MAAHPIEVVGEKLRGMMPWIAANKIVDSEPTFEVQGSYAANRDGRMRIDIFANGQRVFAEGLDGKRAWQLRLTRANGSAADYFIDRESCLPARELSRRALHPDVDPTEVMIETEFAEPLTVDGVVRFGVSEQRNLDTYEWLGTTRLRSVTHNVELPDGFFEAKR